MGRKFLPPSADPPKKIINLLLPEPMYRFVTQEATRRGTTLTQVLRDMIAEAKTQPRDETS